MSLFRLLNNINKKRGRSPFFIFSLAFAWTYNEMLVKNLNIIYFYLFICIYLLNAFYKTLKVAAEVSRCDRFFWIL